MSDTLSTSDVFSQLTIGGSALSSALNQMLMADSIVPGSAPSYQLCKDILLYHPLGMKMAEAPINMAQSEQRDIEVGSAPDRVQNAFKDEWAAMHCDSIIHNCAKLARVYGIATVVLGVEGMETNVPVPSDQLATKRIYFNVLDPLNTAGSLVLNQEPNAPDFQKTTVVATDGAVYHRSRVVVVMNEEPVYISYTQSAFGFVGRSVYQRALYPLKSFIQSMVTDDMITRKAGVLVAKMKQPSSVIDRVMQTMMGAKRALLQSAKTDNVLGIGIEESIETLNLNNIDGAGTFARTNILKNIATAADMPAKLLENETMVEGFGEGTEDAKNIAKYIDRVREWLQPLYDYFDLIVQYRAWNPDFYKILQQEYPKEYGSVKYEAAFAKWQRAFKATWPSLLKEPESEQVKVSDVKLKAMIGVMESLLPQMDPDNKAKLIEWFQDNMNDTEMLFTVPLELDIDAIAEYEPPMPGMGMGEEGGGPGGGGPPGSGQEPKPGNVMPFKLGAAS